MPPQPYVFTSFDELHRELRSAKTLEKEQDFFFTVSTRRDTAKAAAFASAVGNTFRAFPLRRFDLSPSVLYREWATAYGEQHVPTFRTITDAAAMRQFVIAGGRSLDAYWSEATAGRHTMTFGRAAKLFNLLIKQWLRLSFVTDDERRRLLSLCEVPLDTFTLQAVHRLLPACKIPPKAGMSFVKTEAQYEALQDAIRALCLPDSYPLRYELVAWNLSHPEIR